ncbi:MAG: PQQ-binding-like beta-propeller repeat protein [Bacteroidia bacterium]
MAHSIKKSIQDFPKVVGNLIFYFDMDGMFYCQDIESGKLVWKTSMAFNNEDLEGEEAVCLIDGEDIVAGTQYQVFHVSKGSGESRALGLADIGIRDGVLSNGVFCATHLKDFGDLRVFGFDLRTEKKLWEHKIGGDGNMVVVGDRIVIDDNSKKLTCRRIGDGTLVWEKAFPKERQSPLLTDGQCIVFGEKGGTIRFWSGLTGEEVAALKLGERSVTNLCFIDPDHLGLLTQGHFYEIDSRQLSVLHTHPMKDKMQVKGRMIDPSSITASAGYIYFHNTMSRTLYAMDRNTAELVWETQLPRDLSLSIAPGVVGDRLFLVDAQGKLMVFVEGHE